MGCLYSDRKGVLEVPGLPEPMGLDHRDHRDLRAEGISERWIGWTRLAAVGFNAKSCGSKKKVLN